MPLAFTSSTPRSEAGGPIVGFALACLAVPASYATAGHYFAACGLAYWPAGRPMEFAVLCGLPLLLSGLMQWWDVWIRPAPKLGANWSPLSPGQYVGYLFAYHGIVLLVSAYLVVESGRSPSLSTAPLIAVFSTPSSPESDFEAYQREELRRDREAREEEFNRSHPFNSRLPGARPRQVHGNSGQGPGDHGASGRRPGFLEHKFGALFMLAGLVWSLSLPRQSGFSSGQPIQN